MHLTPWKFLFRVLALVCGFGIGRTAAADRTLEMFGRHHGYLFDVRAERDRRDVELVLLDQPKEPKPFADVIFNEQLSREFRNQYEYRFGRTKAEQVLNAPSRDDQYTYSTGQNVTLREYQKYQRQYAEYMGRRLMEFHVDNWAKNDRDFRPVYEMKDRIGRLDVTVRKGYDVKWKYNFSGPNMDLRIENPYDVDFRLRVEMSGIVSRPSEYIYSLGYPLSPRVTMSGIYRQVDGIYQVVWSRRMTRTISATVTGSIDSLPAGPSVQQNLFLVGLSWSD